jgi:translation elongation factor EF-Ts
MDAIDVQRLVEVIKMQSEAINECVLRMDDIEKEILEIRETLHLLSKKRTKRTHSLNEKAVKGRIKSKK